MSSGVAPSDSRATLPVLLVILGGLGDWCIRRVLQHAREFERASNSSVVSLIIDVHPFGIDSDQDSYKHWIDTADRWIVRRLIEQTAEDVDQPLRDANGDAVKNINWGFTNRLAVDPMLPDPTVANAPDPERAIADFVKLLGPLFKAAYEGDEASLISGIEARMPLYLDVDVREELLRNPERTLEKLGRRWALKKSVTEFADIRQAIISFLADQIKDRARMSKGRIENDRNILTAYLGERVRLGGAEMGRYWRSDPVQNKLFRCLANGDTLPVEEAMLERLAQEYRIIVYAATPPNTYPNLLQQWSPYAERIALEKPIAGLLEQNDHKDLGLTGIVSSNEVETTKRIRTAVDKASQNSNRVQGLPLLTISTVDHYNSKWTVAAIEWLKRRKIVNHILENPKRIVIQVLEGGMLPRGRFQFYNGVGGALADMLSHMIQPLRSLTGHGSLSDLLSAMEIVHIDRARYRLNSAYLLNAIGSGFASQKDLAEKLARDTETFGVIHLKFTTGKWVGTDVFIRTGKGFLPQSKTVVVESRDDDGPVALICDIEAKRISLADHGLQRVDTPTNDLPAHVWMVTREFDVPGFMRDSYLQPDSKDYVAVFSGLCSPESLDRRFFPSVEDASQACDFFYSTLMKHRLDNLEGLDGPRVYEADYLGEEVRSWLATEAGWGQLGREKAKGN